MATYERKIAASQMALFEYKFHLLIIMFIVATLLFFWVVAEDKQNIFGAIFSLFTGCFVAFILKNFYYSRKLLKKYNEEQLRIMWLRLGGFSEE